MRNFPNLIFAMAMIFCFCSFGVSALPVVPIIDYRFDNSADITSGIARNSASPNYFGVIEGTKYFAPGVTSFSYLNNNDGDSYITVPNTEYIDLSVDGFTAEVVVMRYTNTSEDGIMEKPNEFLFTILGGGEAGGLLYSVAFTDGTWGELRYVFPNGSYFNNWTRFTITYSKGKTGSTARIFMNGKIVAEHFFAGKFIRFSNSPFIFDAFRSWAKFDGRIDDIKVWNTDLSKGQIAK